MTAPTLPPESQVDAVPARRRPRAPRLRRPSSIDLGRSPWLAGLLAAAWAAVIGLGLAVLPMLLVWMTTADSGLTWSEAARLGGVVWLVANGAGVTIAGVSVSLIPLGLVLVAVLLLAYAGGWAGRRAQPATPRAWIELVVPGAALYAALAAVLAVMTAGAAASVPVMSAAGWALLVALAGLSLGCARAVGMPGRERIPGAVGTVLSAGLVAALALVGIGALAATVSLITHFDDAITMAQSLDTGLAGGLGLLLLGMAYVPVMAVWGAAYVMGAGVLIGPGITVSPFLATTAPTALPPFPLLAALPQGATVIGWLLPLSGVLAGVLAGVTISARARTESRLTRLAMAACAAAVAGIALGVLSLLASGGLGDLRLAVLGPVPMTVGILGAVLVALGAVPSAVVARSPERPRLSVADTTAAPAATLDEHQPSVDAAPREDT